MHYNLINEAMSCKVSTTPKAGMMGTYFVGSDRYKVVCLEVLSNKRVLVAIHGDFPVKTIEGIDYYDGDLGNLAKQYEPYIPEWGMNWTEEEQLEYLKSKTKDITFSLRKNGRWLRAGDSAWSTGSIHWGHAEEYLDPSF